MHRVLTRFGALVLALAMVISPWPQGQTRKADAAGITDITAAVLPTTASTSTVLTVKFKLATGLTTGGKVNIALQGTGPGSGQYSYETVAKNDTGNSVQIDTVAKSTNGAAITATAGSDLSANTEYTVVAKNLTNPSGSSMYMAIIWSTNAAGTSVIDGVAPINGPMTTGIKAGVFGIGNVIYGQVTKADGTPVANTGVQLHTGDFTKRGGSGSNSAGYYSFSSFSDNGTTRTVTDSTSWVLEVSPPMSAQGLTAPDAYSIPSYTGGVLVVNRTFGTAVKTITGKVTREGGVAVVNASVNASKGMGGGGSMANTMTDASGNYTLTVAGGQWQVMLCSGCGGPQGQGATVDWAYSGSPNNITFASNTTVESQTVNFSVITANSTIKGKILKPDGTAPAQGGQGQPSLGINIFSRGGFGTGGGLSGDGSFEVKVPAGSYNVNVYDPSGTYTLAGSTLTVKSSETKDLGTMTLKEKTDIISGTVKTADGTAVAGIGINANMMRGENGDFVNTTTAADGSFQLKVTPGTWMVMAGDMGGQNGQKASIDYVVSGGGKPVNVVSGVTSTISFTAVAANATISGTVVDTNGAVLSSVFGFVMADVGGSASGDMKMAGGMGGGVNNGSFSFKVPAGTYTLNVNTPPGSNYTPKESKEVTVAANATATTSFTMLANDATISGYLVDESGAKVTGLMSEVFATNAGRSFHPGLVNPTDGSYSISVASAAGPWYMGANTDPSSGYFQEPPSQDSIALTVGQTVTKNITVRKANATISGKITDNNGTALSGVMVSADTRTLAKNKNEARGPMFMNDNRTDDNGDYTLKVPAGTYYVNAFVPADRGLIPPKSNKVGVGANVTVTVNLQFRSPDSNISGTVEDGNSNNAGKSALVWAYSEDGAYTETTAGSDGKYELKVTKGDNWHVGANTEGGANNTDKYTSDDSLISTGQNATNAKDIVLSKASDGLPSATNASADVTTAKSIKLSDSAQIDLPANSLGTEGQATISVTPSAESGHQYLNKPLEDKAYDITAVNSSGSAITSLNSNATITLPYDPTVLETKGLNESTNDIVPAYWNDTDGTWTTISGGTINKDSNTITFTTNHFTKYSLVAASDAATAAVTTVTELPKTGENNRTAVYLLVAVMIACLGFFGASRLVRR